MLRDPDLPDALYAMPGEVAPAYQRSQDERLARLAQLGSIIAAKRDEAVSARLTSGIEAIWKAAEEAYLGIDEVNRSQFAGSRWAKPTSPGGSLTAEKDTKTNKSTAFVPLTARYVDMGYAKVSEIILPIDDKPFSIDATPIPDMVAAMMDATPVTAPDGSQTTKGALLSAQIEQARAKAKKEEDWIYDNFVESNYPREMRKVLFDAARIGTGVLKGPLPVMRKSQAFSVGDDGAGKLEIVQKIRPGVQQIDVWNLFPAPGCGEDIHAGDHIFERDHFSPGKLKELKKLKDQFGAPLFIAPQIDKVLAEGPGKENAKAGSSDARNKEDRKHQFEVWTFHGTLTVQDMRDMGAPGVEDLPEDVVEVFAVVTLVNDTVIRATINPLDSGRFPYRVMCWQRRAGFWAGVGISERVEVAQRMINGATRAMLNNAGKSGGSQIVIDRRSITPADGSWDLNTGDKVWLLTGEALVEDVKQIFLTYSIPNVTPQMLTIIDYALKLAEQSTNLPLVAQGQTGKDDPETFGQAELQNDNANVLLRSIAWEVDDSVTEPTVRDFHEWYLLDPEVPEEDKGDFDINAKGSIAMVERSIQEQTYAQLLPLAQNPMWGQNPKKLFAQYMRIKRLNPADTEYSDAEIKQLQSVQPPPPPQVQVAQINAAKDLHKTEMLGQQKLQEIAAEAAHEHNALVAGGTTPHEATAMAQIERERIRALSAERIEDSRAHAEAARADRELQVAQTASYTALEELRLQRELALLEYANKQHLTLMQVQGQLANTALQGQIKRQLQGADHALEQGENAQDRAHATAERQAVEATARQTEADAAASQVAGSQAPTVADAA